MKPKEKLYMGIGALFGVVAVGVVIGYAVREKNWDYYNTHDQFGSVEKEHKSVERALLRMSDEVSHHSSGGRSSTQRKSAKRSGGHTHARQHDHSRPDLGDHHHADDHGLPGGPMSPAQIKAFFKELDKEIAKRPNDRALRSRKIHLAFSADPQVAVDECKHILSEDPENFFALNHCASAYMLLEDYQKALEYAGLARQVSGDTPYIRTLVGQIHYRKGDLPAARTQYEKALAMDPRFTEAVHGLALVKQTQKNHAAAR